MFEKHLYDCPDCLGTGYEEPAKRIMNLELMLNQHKETLKSSDAHNNELAQQLEIAWEQRDRLAEALKSMLENQPAMINGDLFYPRYTPDGDDAGEEYVNPLSLIFELYGRMQEALAAVKGGSHE